MSTAHGIEELGNSVDATGAQAAKRWRSGKGLFIAEAGTWSTAVANLQLQTPEGTWINVPSVTVSSANNMVEFDLPAGQIRLNVITGTPTDLFAWAASITT